MSIEESELRQNKIWKIGRLLDFHFQSFFLFKIFDMPQSIVAGHLSLEKNGYLKGIYLESEFHFSGDCQQ